MVMFRIHNDSHVQTTRLVTSLPKRMLRCMYFLECTVTVMSRIHLNFSEMHGFRKSGHIFGRIEESIVRRNPEAMLEKVSQKQQREGGLQGGRERRISLAYETITTGAL